MTRVAIIGCGGAGKSTFAAELGKKTGLPVIHLDALYWRPTWIPMQPAEWKRLHSSLVDRSEWIIDGNYGSTMDIRLSAADTIVFVDLPRVSCLLGVFRRFMFRRRVDEIEGCEERITFSFMRWIWYYRRVNAPKIIRKLRSLAASKAVFIVRRRRELRRLLRTVQEALK